MDIVPFLNKVNSVILNPLLEVLFAIATIYFVYAVIKLITASATAREEARKSVMYALIGMFIMVSVYGIINLIVRSFALNTGSTAQSTSYIQTKLNQ